MFYEGCISNIPNIRESIDLAKSTAKSSNISVSLANFKFNGSDFSEELFGGTNKYINHTVKIYSQLNDESTLSNCLQIYEGRLTDISHDESSIDLQIEVHNPWSNINVATNKTQNRNKKIPIGYGAFTANTATSWGSPQYATALTGTDYRPIPYNDTKLKWALYPSLGTQIPNAPNPAVWDKSLNIFIPVAETTAAVEIDGAFHERVRNGATRALYIRPIDNESITEDVEYTVTNEDRAYDTNTSNYMSVTINEISVNDVFTFSERFSIPIMEGAFSRATIYCKYELIISSIDGDLTNVDVYCDTDYGSISDLNNTSSVGTTTANNSLSAFAPSVNIRLVCTVDDNDFFGSLTAELRIYDIYALSESITDDKTDEQLYTGSDGYKDYDLYNNDTNLSTPYYWIGGAGSQTAITEIHQTHRDLIHRYTQNADTSPNGWSDLDTARDGWDIRWWAVEQEPLIDVLELLQYEGGFIARMGAAGTLQYVHIPNTPSAVHTLTPDDFDNLKVEHTPFPELLTKQEIQYERHPTETQYITKVTSTNSSSRTAWNVDTKENISTVDLDAYVAPAPTISLPGTNPNDDFASYYDNIFGTIKVVGSCNVKNPSYYNIEVGDMIDFTSMNVKSFADAWTKVYMITEQKRSPGNMFIKFREV